MRKIKFRAWHKKFKQMYEVESISFADGLIHLKAFDDDREEWTYIEEFLQDVELLQYTGFRNKNCVEIYEGDILGKELHSNLEVKFKEGLFVAERNEHDGLFIFAAVEQDYEILGNIYENKELLK